MLNLNVVYVTFKVENTYGIKISFIGDDLYQITKISNVINNIEVALYKYIMINKEKNCNLTYTLTPECNINLNDPVIHWSFNFMFPEQDMQSLVYDRLYSIVGNSK